MGSISTRTCDLKAKKTSGITLSIVVVASLAGGAGYSKTSHDKPVSQSSPRTASLCARDEAVLASCSVERKLASVCGRNGRATYRFGRPGRIELTATRLHHAHQMFAGGGESQIVVTAGFYRYVVYDRAIRRGFDDEGHNPLAFTSGLIVLRKGRQLASKLCEPMNTDIIDTNAASNFMSAGAYVWHE